MVAWTSMLEILFYGFLLISGIFLILFRPFARLSNISTSWEIGAGSLLVIAFIFLLTTNYGTPGISDEDLAKKPCGSDSPQGACYSLERGLCEKAWDNAEQGCKGEIAALNKARPSALMGPAMNRCKAKKMDQFLRFNRANSDSPFCKAYFDFIQTR